jgi:hypothetical protein
LKIPTDLEILELIYQEYDEQFSKYDKKTAERDSKIMIPIDVAEIARELNVDGDIVFGRLYYHLESKYGYTNDDGSKVKFFALKAGTQTNCINFPYMASVLANLQDEKRKFNWSLAVAIVAVIISLISLWGSSC